MNVLNRLLGLVLLVLLLAVAVVTLGLVTGVLTAPVVDAAWPYAPVHGITQDVIGLRGALHWYLLGGAIVLILLTVQGIKAELTPPPRRARLFVVRSDGPGRTEVDYQTLDDLAGYSARRVTGVERVRARVERRRNTLAVQCRAVLSPFTDLKATGAAIERSVTEDLSRVTGVAVEEVRVRATLRDERARRLVR